MVTIRIKSLVWFVTGAMLATAVTLMFVNAWRVDAAPGDTDATLVPITPCRLVDTRLAGGPLTAQEVRTVTAHGTSGPIVASQCTIPADAVGLSMNVTADQPSAQSFWTFWPDGVAQPTSSNLNPAPGGPPTPNAVTTPISTAGKFKVYNDAGTVDIIIDVNGYYTKTSLTELAARVTANETNIASLDDREPFAATARDDLEVVTSTDETVVSVKVTAPAAGQVTVNSSTTADEGFAGDDVRCSITTPTTPAAVDKDYLQWWESAGTDGGLSQLAGTRVFDIAAGEIATYDLVCDHIGASADSALVDSVLTAIFTPAP